MIQANPTLLERKNRSSAKAIQDEKAKKRAKKEKKHKRERDHSTNGDLENGFKHKKHKSKDKIEKAEAKAEKKRLKKEEKREKRRRKELGKCYHNFSLTLSRYEIPISTERRTFLNVIRR